ncbi:MAG: hypothetical protein ACLUNO_12580 [Oscillospiraceae bacterium]
MPGFRKEDLASIEVLCHTGGVCSQDLKREWLEIIPPERLYELYAVTECIGMTSIRGDEWLRHPAASARCTAAGSRIRGEDGQRAAARRDRRDLHVVGR